MDYDAFINKWLGKAIVWDVNIGPQCVEEVAQYCVDNGKPVAYANAFDWWEHPALTGTFDFILNDFNDVNQAPNRGEIVIFKTTQPGSGGFGHINIFDSKINDSLWQGLDQNWTHQYVEFIPNHIWDYVQGWMRLKVQPVAATPVAAPTPVPEVVHPVVEAPVTIPTPVVEPTPPVVPTPEVVVPTPAVEAPVVTPPIYKPLASKIKSVNLLQWVLNLLFKLFVGRKN